MHKNLGAIVGLYPTPVTIVGTDINDRVNWINIAHIGIIGVDKMLISMNKIHYSNEGIKQNKTLSINIISEDMLIEADYVGIVSGAKVSKENVFKYFRGELKGAPLIESAPICMECEVVDNYETNTHDNFIVKPVNTYVKEEVLNEKGKIDYTKVRPVLFEMPNRQYLNIGNVIGSCWKEGEKYIK